MSKLGDAGYPQGNALFPTSVGGVGRKPVGYVEQGAEGAAAGTGLSYAGPTVAAFGHSMLANGWAGASFWTWSGGTGIAGVVVAGLQVNAPASAGLLWNSSARTLAWNGGVPVTITRGGPWRIPGPTAQSGVDVAVNFSALPTASVTVNTVTRSGSMPINANYCPSPLVHMNYRLGGTATIHNYAAGQTSAADTLATMQKVLAFRKYSTIIIHALTNSIAFGGTAAQALIDIIACIELAKANNANVIVVQELPLRTAFNTQAMRNAVRYVNQVVYATYAQDTQVTTTDLYSSMLSADPAITTLRSGWSLAADNTHPADQAGFLAGAKLAQLVMGTFRTKEQQFGSAMTPYNASTSPYGNLIPNPYLFGNSAGLFTGAAKSDTNVAGTASKVARTDGLDGEYQRVTLATSTASASVSHIQFGANIAGGAVAIAVPPAGTWCQGRAEVVVNANALMPDMRVLTYAGATTLSQTRSSGTNNTAIAMPNSQHSGIITTPPFQMPSGADGIAVYLSAYGLTGTTGTFDWGRVEIRPLTADETFDCIDWLCSLD